MKFIKIARIYLIIVFVACLILPVFTESSYGTLLPAAFYTLILILACSLWIKRQDSKGISDEEIKKYAHEKIKPKVKKFFYFFMFLIFITMINQAIQDQDIMAFVFFGPIILAIYAAVKFFTR